MKKFTSLFLFMALLWVASADAQSQKITFVEHFSNSQCPICINNREKIEGDLNKYKSEINTMTIHHRPPYPNCELYLYAKEEVDNRVDVYAKSIDPIPGSPTLCVNSVPGSHNRLTINIDEALKDKEVLVGLNMTESGGTTKKASLEVFNLTNAAMENLYVYAALVENSTSVTHNGENYTIHHVFRKFLGNQKGKGDAVGKLGAGESKTIVLEGQVPNDLNPSDLYILAWVEQRVPEGDKYEIIMHNSVSKTTSVITNNELEIPASELSIYPNPASDALHLRNTSDFQPDRLRILSAAGQEIKRINRSVNTIEISDLVPGQYYLILENQTGRVSRKFIKQ